MLCLQHDVNLRERVVHPAWLRTNVACSIALPLWFHTTSSLFRAPPFKIPRAFAQRAQQ